MKKSFTLGAITGATSLAIALPMFAHMASAATDPSVQKSRPIPTQACVHALAERDTNFLASIDTRIAAQKTATAAHRDALLLAAKITDNAEHQEALKKAHEDMRTAMKAALGTQDRSAEITAMKTVCGHSFHDIKDMRCGGDAGQECTKRNHGRGKNYMLRGERQK